MRYSSYFYLLSTNHERDCESERQRFSASTMFQRRLAGLLAGLLAAGLPLLAQSQQYPFLSAAGLHKPSKQYALSDPSGYQLTLAPFTNDSFSPFGTLDTLSAEAYTVIGHPAFPNHSVRIKKSSFCDSSVKCVVSTRARVPAQI